MSLNRVVRAARFLSQATRSVNLLKRNGWELTYPPSISLIKSAPLQRLFFHTTCQNKDATHDKSNQPDDNNKYSGSDSSSGNESSSDSSSDEDEVDPKLASAAADVAKSLPGDASKTKSDLLSKLREHVTLSNQQKQGKLPPSSLKSVFGGMKTVQRHKKKLAKEDDKREAGPEIQEDRMEDYDQVTTRQARRRGGERQMRERSARKDEQPEGTRQRQGRRYRKAQSLDDLDIFNSPPLGIFGMVRKSSTTEPESLSLYDCIQKELESAEMTYPPQTAFEEWSRWTKEGKMWTYPIDNEEGMEEEASVGFHEHVFLDHFLEDFPKRGPVRHFMELVLNGLSKNPYLTVSQKKEHIEWYKQYFSDKHKLIEELTITASSQETKLE